MRLYLDDDSASALLTRLLRQAHILNLALTRREHPSPSHPLTRSVHRSFKPRT